MSQSNNSSDKISHISIDNEFWDNDAQLKARCLLSKGRIIYKEKEAI